MDLGTFAIIIQAIASVVLVLITIFYAYSSHKNIKEMQLTREIENLPRLIPKIVTWSDLEHGFETNEFPVIINTGKGTAFNVKINIVIESDNTNLTWTTSALEPGKRFGDGYDYFGNPDYTNTSFSKKKTCFNIEYDTLLGNSVKNSIILENPIPFNEYGESKIVNPTDLEKISSSITKISELLEKKFK